VERGRRGAGVKNEAKPQDSCGEAASGSLVFLDNPHEVK
jgi:hypothetical protein